MIPEFRGVYADFSNFAHAPFRYGELDWDDTETPYHFYKTTDEEQRAWVRAAPNAREAKKRGRKVTLRPDWEQIKRPLMFGLNRRKFQNSSRAHLLLSTDGKLLIEGNTWGDQIWGCILAPYEERPDDPEWECYPHGNDSFWVGRNLLGKTLMTIRSELRIEYG